MMYLILADCVLFLHLGWILFTILGALIAQHYLWLKRIHICVLLYGLLIEIFAWICPLTHLENWFRDKSSLSSSYSGDFIGHYIGKLIYLDVSRIWLVAGAIVVIGFNLWVYSRKRVL